MEGAPLASAGAPRLSGEGTWGLSEAECQQRPGLDHARWGAGAGRRGGAPGWPGKDPSRGSCYTCDAEVDAEVQKCP